METESLRTAALKRQDARFETAPRDGRVRLMTWVGVLVIVLVLSLGPGILLFSATKVTPGFLVSMLLPDGLVIVLLALAWMSSRIQNITLQGQLLSIKMTFWTARFDLNGLRSAGLDAEVFKCSLRTFGNGGLGAFHGYFWSKRMGKFRGYVTDTSRVVVLRWEDAGKCVVVSPKDTEYFIEEVCKRTGARRQN